MPPKCSTSSAKTRSMAPASATSSGQPRTSAPEAPATVGGRLFGRLSGLGTKAILWFLVVIWLVPTLGLFISSFRPEADIKTSGWWTFFSDPEVTLDNYDFVLFGTGSGAA